MSRARYLKPTFFTNERIGELDPLHRLAFQGLWCQADREGRLKDRPKSLRIEILPYDDVDFDGVLQALHEAGFIVRYEADGERCIWLPSFLEHQRPHPKEPASTIPAPSMNHASAMVDSSMKQPSRNVPGKDPLNGMIIKSESVAVAESVGAAATAEPDDPAVRMFRAWEAATGTTVTRQVGERLDAWLDKLPEAAVLKAIVETGNNGAKRWSYTEAILERFQRDGWESDAKPQTPSQRQPPEYRQPTADELFPPVTKERLLAAGKTEEGADEILAKVGRK